MAGRAEEIDITTRDGWRLRGVHHRGAGRAVVLCGHAMMVDSRTFLRGGVADLLAERGFEVYRYDLRGHGRSRAPDGGVGRWSYDDVVLGDIPDLVAHLRRRHPGLPLAVVGHSLVGHGCLAWLGQERDAAVDAVVAVAANAWIRRLEPSPWRWAQKRLLMEAWLAIARPLGYFPARRLRIGTDDVSLPYVEQFTGWTRSGAWTTCDGRDFLAGLANVRAPVLAVLGAADRLYCAPECGREFARHLSRSRVTVWEVGRHELPGLVPDHMRLVTSPRARPLWERIAHWLHQTLGTGSPPAST